MAIWGAAMAPDRLPSWAAARRMALSGPDGIRAIFEARAMRRRRAPGRTRAGPVRRRAPDPRLAGRLAGLSPTADRNHPCFPARRFRPHPACAPAEQGVTALGWVVAASDLIAALERGGDKGGHRLPENVTQSRRWRYGEALPLTAYAEGAVDPSAGKLRDYGQHAVLCSVEHRRAAPQRGLGALHRRGPGGAAAAGRPLFRGADLCRRSGSRGQGLDDRPSSRCCSGASARATVSLRPVRAWRTRSACVTARIPWPSARSGSAMPHRPCIR
jgi:hypothetical protein